MSENQNKFESNSELARKCVCELKAKHPNFSSSQIASMIGMSQPTFSRLENGQTKPTLNTISILLSGLGKSHYISQAIEIANPSLASMIKENLAHNAETPILGGEFASFFRQVEHRNIMLLAMTRSGTTRAEIQLEYGNAGIRKLEELLKESILMENRGIIKADDEKVTFDQDALKSAVISAIEQHYDPEKYGTGENWLSFQTESVNKAKAMALIRAKLQKVYKEIKEEILYSPEYFGNDKVFVAMVADSLLKDLVASSEVIQ